MATRIGQVLQLDKIGSLTESGGTITLGPSRMTIGGVQVETDSSLQVTPSGLTANTRYQIFAVLSSGAVQLEVSTNENSVGPSGFSAWKLVGSFYADNSGNFQVFVEIDGIPRTQWHDAVVDGSWTTNTSYVCKKQRVGEVLNIDITVNLSGAPNSTGLGVNLPNSLSLNASKLSDGGSNDISNASVRLINSGTNNHPGGIVIGDLTTLNVLAIDDDAGNVSTYRSVTDTAPFSWANGDAIHIKADSLPIDGWTQTPIKDL